MTKKPRARSEMDASRSRALSVGDDQLVEVAAIPEQRSLAVAIHDNVTAIVSARHAITASGHRVVLDATGRDGFAAVIAQRAAGELDAVVVGLPQGQAVIDGLLALPPPRPVIIAAVTGLASEVVARAVEAGADLAVPKPYAQETLALVLLAAGRLATALGPQLAAAPAAPVALPRAPSIGVPPTADELDQAFEALSRAPSSVGHLIAPEPVAAPVAEVVAEPAPAAQIQAQLDAELDAALDAEDPETVDAEMVEDEVASAGPAADPAWELAFDDDDEEAGGAEQVLLARDAFDRRVEVELELAQRHQQPVALGVFALAFDEPPPPGVPGILRARIGTALLAAIRDTDIATRLSDESSIEPLDHERFVVLFPETALADAADVARTILDRASSVGPIAMGGRTIVPRVIGAVVRGANGRPATLPRLLRDAADALANAVRDGAELAVPL